MSDKDEEQKAADEGRQTEAQKKAIRDMERQIAEREEQLKKEKEKPSGDSGEQKG